MITRKETYPQERSYTKLLLGQSSLRLTGYTGSLRAEELSVDIEGRTTATHMSVDRAARRRTVTRTSPGIGTATSVFQDGLVISETTADGRVFTFGYDKLNRLDEARDPRTGTTRTAYLMNTTRIETRHDPGNRLLVQYAYDAEGRPTTAWNGAAQPSYLSYNARGQVLRQWGPAATPVEYGYNGYGDRVTMTTFRASDAAALGGGWPTVAGDTTNWTVDEATGLVHRKTDPAGRAMEYTYDLAGRVATRRSARNLVATYTYTAAGERSRVAYSDTTPAVAYSYNRLGQPTVIVDGAGSRQLTYDATRPWRLETERLDTAFFGGRTLRTLYETGDAVGRIRGFELTAGATVELAQAYGFGAGGRVESVQASHRESGSLVSRTFQYGYLAQSALVQSLSIQGAHPFTLNRAWAPDRDLLTSIDTRWSTAVVADYDYGHDAAGRRTSRVQSGTAFADYGQPTFTLFTYNTRSELTAAVDYLGGTITDTSKPLPGRRNEYAYDTIGNRVSSGRNGVAGTEEDTTSNNLNQIVTRENHAVPFSGTAAPDATVKVAGRPVLAGRQGAYWYDETTVPNTSGPYRGPRYAMAKPAGQNVVRIDGRMVSLAQALQTFTYDLDGNLTQDGIWTYTWDAEGRLVAMATTPTAVAAGFVEQTLRFVYDHLGRRVRKEVFGDGSALVSRTIWIYDGWNMIAEYDQPAIGGALTLKRSYAWGLDLLGSLRASGGVGALLQLRDYSENATYLAGYDGNGNLTTLHNAATGTLAATYEYGPYGEPIATSGAYADKNPVRFSTKYTDDETGLVYYGRRYYDPRNGRFLGRDPIEEKGGINLYGFVLNNPANAHDVLGMTPIGTGPEGMVQFMGQWINEAERATRIQMLNQPGYWGMNPNANQTSADPMGNILPSQGGPPAGFVGPQSPGSGGLGLGGLFKALFSIFHSKKGSANVSIGDVVPYDGPMPNTSAPNGAVQIYLGAGRVSDPRYGPNSTIAGGPPVSLPSGFDTTLIPGFSIAVGVSGTGGAVAGATTSPVGVVVAWNADDGLQVGSIHEAGGGTYFGYSGSAGIFVQIASADTLSSIRGKGMSWGGSVSTALGPSVGIDVVTGDPAGGWHGLQLSFAAGGGNPVEIHGFATYTWIMVFGAQDASLPPSSPSPKGPG